MAIWLYTWKCYHVVRLIIWCHLCAPRQHMHLHNDKTNKITVKLINQVMFLLPLSFSLVKCKLKKNILKYTPHIWTVVFLHVQVMFKVSILFPLLGVYKKRKIKGLFWQHKCDPTLYSSILSLWNFQLKFNVNNRPNTFTIAWKLQFPSYMYMYNVHTQGFIYLPPPLEIRLSIHVLIRKII